MTRDLTEQEVEDLQRISALCKQIIVKAGPMIFDNRLDRDLRSMLDDLSKEAKHARNHLRSNDIIPREDDRWTPRQSSGSSPAISPTGFLSSSPSRGIPSSPSGPWAGRGRSL